MGVAARGLGVAVSEKPDLTAREAGILVRHFGYRWSLGPLTLNERDTETGREWKLTQEFLLHPPGRRVVARIHG